MTERSMATTGCTVELLDVPAQRICIQFNQRCPPHPCDPPATRSTQALHCNADLAHSEPVEWSQELIAWELEEEMELTQEDDCNKDGSHDIEHVALSSPAAKRAPSN